jgi:UDP-3-O-[3-hydroxymyristoyl] N-acetylglucosamine deacetylase/3-hydroxyacyl-[acyl-carrier-protein] dehydratase
MTEYQCTIKKPVSVSGTGLHTGQQGTLTFRPAPTGHGVVFCRVDKPEKPLIKAHVSNVVDTSRGTTIGVNGTRVYTIEHVMASLTGLGIDNVLIELDMEETPIRDGSARYFVEALTEAGIQVQDEPREYLIIDEELRIDNDEKGFWLSISPAGDYSVDVTIDYGTQVLNVQNASMGSLGDFALQIAPCRTFVFLHELEYLLGNNLIKGGDLSNAIVFVNRKVSQEELDRLAELFNKPKVKVKEEGILNNLELHFPNEPARHKLLDVVGDLSLVGMRIKGHVKAYRPGHYANTEFAKIIFNQYFNQINHEKRTAIRPAERAGL